MKVMFSKEVPGLINSILPGFNINIDGELYYYKNIRLDNFMPLKFIREDDKYAYYLPKEGNILGDILAELIRFYKSDDYLYHGD